MSSLVLRPASTKKEAVSVRTNAALPLLPLARIVISSMMIKRGAPGRSRTCYQGFRKPLLYPMSYERKMLINRVKEKTEKVES